MKKTLKYMLAIGCVATLAFGASACAKDGASAYELAVQNGFVGTEQEWLQSLHGANGNDGSDLDAKALYEEAVAQGYTGTFLEFCQAFGVTINANNDTVQLANNMMSAVGIHVDALPNSGGWFGGGSFNIQSGSGVIIDINKEAGNATILTNYHVVYEALGGDIAEDIWVYLYGAHDPFLASGGEEKGDGMRARFVGGSMDYDIAVLKVEGNEYLRNSKAVEAELGDSEALRVGEETYVIGTPEGAGLAVTNGILSVTSEYIEIAALDNRDENKDGAIDSVSYRVMRTSAAINGGNSGGGMFDKNGKLIGIVNAKSAGSETDNMGYALPISQVKAVYENILANDGKVMQATLGILVSVQSSKAELDADGNLFVVEEFVVSTEAEKGASSYQKLSAGDIFVAAAIGDGETQTFTRQYQLTELLLSVRKGDSVTFTVRNSSGDEERVVITFDKDEYFRRFV